MQEFFDWAMLGTYAGAVLCTGLVTQLTKGLGFIDRIPTRLWSYLAALAVLVAAAFATGQASWSNLALCAVNAVVVALAAQGGYAVAAGGVRTKDV